jgi:DNA polymerase III subunit delta'
MPFSDFHGNHEVVRRVREMLAHNRLPQAVILAGPPGSGKYTLALMLAKAMNCLSPVADSGGRPEFCGKCSNCVRITESADLEARVAEAIETRENLREADKKETRIFVQTHPDVLIIPPDPPQLMIKVDQIRRVIEGIYFRPAEGRERVYIFTDSAFMKEAANSLLKVLEEAPEFATIFLLTDNPGELLPTIRSRSMVVLLAALPVADVEAYLAAHRSDWNAKQHSLAARLCQGAIGRARSFDLAGYQVARAQALIILNSAVHGKDHGELFKATETFRSGAEGREKTAKLLQTIYSLLQDLMFLNSQSPELVRNVDILPELKRLAENTDFEWIAGAADRVDDIERGMRRNLLRALSLDAFAVALERGT